MNDKINETSLKDKLKFFCVHQIILQFLSFALAKRESTKSELPRPQFKTPATQTETHTNTQAQDPANCHWINVSTFMSAGRDLCSRFCLRCVYATHLILAFMIMRKHASAFSWLPACRLTAASCHLFQISFQATTFLAKMF